MSRPRSGVVEVFAGTTGLTDIEQGSGVLVAPDEVLTAAHVVDGAGGIRSDIDVVTGTGIGTSPPSSDYAPATVHVAPGFVPSPDGVESGTVTAHDFALIHLSRPVSGTVYALGSSDGGTLTVGGYPAGLGSTYDEATETFTSYSPLAQAGVGPGTFEAKPLGEGTDPHGSSGGPVIDPNAGTPTVVGIVQGTDTSDRMGDFVQLTDADVAEIQGWIAADHGEAAPRRAAPALSAAATRSPPSAGPAPSLAPSPSSASSLQALASAIAGDAASAPTLARQTALSDVSNALTYAAACGAPDLGAGWSDAAALIRAGSDAPRRALAYLGGLLSALVGSPRPRAASDAVGLFPSLSANDGHPMPRAFAAGGWTALTAFSASQASGEQLSAAIASPPPLGDPVSPAGAAVAPVSTWIPHAHQEAR